MNWLSALGILFISYFSYTQSIEATAWLYETSGFDHSFFKLIGIFPWQGMALLYLAIIVYVTYDFIRILKQSRGEQEFIATEI